MKLWHKFILANLIALAYAALSFFLAGWWINDLSAWLDSRFLAWAIVVCIAVIPGYFNVLLLSSLYFYKYEPVDLKDSDYPPVTIIVPAYNEEDDIGETFRGIKQQDYPNAMEIIIVDDGSTDNTLQEIAKANINNLKVIKANHGGKAAALNLGLQAASHETIVTIDADSFFWKNAVRRIVARIVSDGAYAAVAGHVLVKNERSSRLARIQSWDYMVGISAVKRQQGLFMGTLVAQGAFSVFRKQALFSVNGWQDRLGEDIVLTWALLKKGYKIGYEPTAFIFTNVPVNYSGFFLQRQRWARGMIEGFKAHISLIWKGKSYSSFFVSLNLFFPIIDSFFTFVFLPGLVLVFFGIYHIVGLATLFVLPITAFIIIVMLRMQKSFMDYAGLKMRYNPVGMVFYAMVYQLVMSPICVLGYFKELFNFKRQW